MQERLQFYIDGKWVDPVTPKTIDVINPATEEAFARVSLGSKADVDKAVKAARRAFESFSRTTREERLALLEKIIAVYKGKYQEIAEAISLEMGAPLWLSKAAQAGTGLGQLTETAKILKDYKFEETRGNTAIVKEPVGVCGFITPWNWPINQIVCKVAPALAAGCTIILKPSEVAPMNAMLFADVLHEAGVPRRPSISTRHSRQLPKASSESVAHSLGIAVPTLAAAAISEVPFAAVTFTPSMVSVTVSVLVRAGVPKSGSFSSVMSGTSA